MVTIGIYTVSIILIILGYVKRRSRIIAALIMVLGALIIICVSNAQDMLNLENRYIAMNFYDLPILFRKIMLYLTSTGKSFVFFKLCYALLTFGGIYFLYEKNTKNIAFACALFYIYPGICFIGQIRNGISAVIAMLGLLFFIKSNYKYKRIIYVGIIILAVSIHPASICYLIFLLSDIKIRKREYICVFVIFSIAIIILLYSGCLYLVLSKIIYNGRILQYLIPQKSPNMVGSVLAGVGQLLWTGLIIYVRDSLNELDWNVNNSNKRFNNNQVNQIVRLNELLLILLPFYAISHMVFRIYKYMLIIDYLVIVQATKNRKHIFSLSLFLAVCSFGAQIFVDGGIKNIFIMFNDFNLNTLKLAL